jgi:hypothetical protein
MATLARQLSALPDRVGDAPWSGHEYVRGWGVMGLPFDSGHVLALRVFPQGSFAPYRTVWHRTPDGEWSIYVDAPSADVACPRYYGAACSTIAHAAIRVTWTGPRTLHVTVDSPSLEWDVTAARSVRLGLLNPVSAALPLWTWRPPRLLRARERLARALGMGDLALSGVMPSGHVGLLMPQRMHFVDESRATLQGVDLGRPARTEVNPAIGGVPLPARGVLAIGQAMWPVLDQEEFDRTRSELRPSTT